MQLGAFTLTRRPDGDYSLSEKVSVPGEGDAAVETVERARFSFQVFWLVVAAAGKVLTGLLKALLWLARRKKHR